MVFCKVDEEIAEADNGRPSQTTKGLLNDGLPKFKALGLPLYRKANPLKFLVGNHSRRSLYCSRHVCDEFGAFFWCHLSTHKRLAGFVGTGLGRPSLDLVGVVSVAVAN